MTEISNAQNPAATSDAAPKGARARPVVSIAIDQIEVGARLRHLRPEKVDEIAESIAAQSLLQSIIVRRRGAGYELVASLHRLEASRKCGHEAIRAEICDTATSDDEAALIQIDENLCRAELSPAESAAHYAARGGIGDEAPFRNIHRRGPARSGLSPQNSCPAPRWTRAVGSGAQA